MFGEDTNRLDNALDELGNVYASKAGEVQDISKGQLGYKSAIYAMKETKNALNLNRVLNGMRIKGIAEVAIKAFAEKITTGSTGFGHGYVSPGVAGLFYETMDPNIVNALQLPLPGLDAILPEIPVVETHPLYGIITGQTAGSGSAPSTECSPWGEAGLTKICRQVNTLGRVGISSRSVNLERMGNRLDRSDFVDYRLVGDPVGASTIGDVPTGLAGIGQANNFLNDEFAKVMRELEVEAIRRFAGDIWTSNPSSGADAWHTAWYRGLDILVNTGQTDSITNIACPKSDSKIINFATVATGGNNISTTASAASTIVDIVADLWYVLNREAREEGLDPIEWVFVGTPELFRELTAAWPCSYLTNRCLSASSNNPNQVEASQQVAMREEMRKGNFLWIDAQQVPFIQDSSISQTQGSGASGAGTFTSTLYLLPLTVRGRFPVLTKTYFDNNAPGAAADVLRRLGNLSYGMSVSPDGKFVHNLEKTGTCFQISATKRPGLVLRTPYLAARVTNIAYKPRLVTNSWNPGAASFYANGGSTSGSGPSFWDPQGR